MGFGQVIYPENNDCQLVLRRGKCSMKSVAEQADALGTVQIGVTTPNVKNRTLSSSRSSLFLTANRTLGATGCCSTPEANDWLKHTPENDSNEILTQVIGLSDVSGGGPVLVLG
jgi:hypothetical protein